MKSAYVALYMYQVPVWLVQTFKYHCSYYNNNLWGCDIGITQSRNLWSVIGMGSSSFIKIGTGVQTILRFCLSNLKCCNTAITDGRDLWCTPLKWAKVSCYNTKFQGDQYWHLNNITAITSTIFGTVMFALLIKGIYEVHC
jgi:hypothetical protein